LTSPVAIAAHTTRSKMWRSRSLSRKRPSRFSENDEWCGTLSYVHLAEPPARQVQLDFLAQLAFRADAVVVADDEHPDHQLRIN
jgi:hypothetical protein